MVEFEDAVGRRWSEDVVELEAGPRPGTDISARLMPRNPAQVRARSPGLPDGPNVTPRVHIGAWDEVDAALQVSCGMPSHTSVRARAEGIPGNVHSRPKIVVLEDDRGVDDMRAHAESIYKMPDCIGQQVHSCFANGKMYNVDEMRVVVCMLSGADITEVFSLIRVNKVCKKFGSIPGDSFDLRDGYDLSDEVTQAYVIRRVRETNPKLVIGSPPCAMLSGLQALNIHVQGPE